MITTDCGTGPPALLTQISTTTVDRRWVHREAVSEVFLTDVIAAGPDAFTAHCQLPRRHTYYGDVPDGVVDPMVLLECCRQAETCGAHTMLGVPLGSSFVLTGWSLTGDMVRRDDLQPVNVDIEVQARPRPGGRGSATCAWAMELSIEGDPVGEVTMDVTYLPSRRYSSLRGLRRCGRPPALSEVRGRAHPPAALDLGRADPRNVLLSDVTAARAGSDLVARLRVPTDHPSLFDHPLDHVPGMALTEAAKQLAVAVTGQPLVTGLDGVFHRFVELDEDAEVAAGASRDGVTVRVLQNGALAAEMAVRCAPAQSRGAVA